ncbi:MAG: single-stranded DNA-binding protein [Corallococcus sp.]|nr:single-stranded DNA-binding protein [Corallococcus sp.]MCM1395738.1 single-stranded DNA-binding protein [Corallococcus sp.]
MGNETSITAAQKQMIEKRLQECVGFIEPGKGQAHCIVSCLNYLTDKLRYSNVPFVSVMDATQRFVKKFFNNVNQSSISGNLTSDPELRTSKNNKTFCTFSIAVTRDYRSGNDNDYKTDFFKVEVWNLLASKAAKYLKKGNKVLVSGAFEQYIYDIDGAKRYDYKLKANKIEVLTPELGDLDNDITIQKQNNE